MESTTALKVATGIVNIWTADARTVAESFHRINTAHPGRFVFGIGAGHPEHTEQYRKPYDALVDYLDELDEYGVPATQRVLAALGPRVLRLAAERTAGAHPYNTTPEHTAQARKIIGPNALLAPEHKVLSIADAEEALAVGREVLAKSRESLRPNGGSFSASRSWRAASRGLRRGGTGGAEKPREISVGGHQAACWPPWTKSIC